MAVRRLTDLEEWEAAAAVERTQIADLHDLADDFALVAEPLWHLGDGEGGFVRNVLEEAFERHELRRWERTPSKKKPSVTGQLRIDVYERDEYRCRHCGTCKDLSIDHIVPECDGGPTTLDNLQTLCRTCNSRKGTGTDEAARTRLARL